VGASSEGAPSGPHAINPKPRVNPGLSSPGPSGQRHDFSYIRAFGKYPNSSPRHFVPGLATIVLFDPRGTRPSLDRCFETMLYG
jgi:hypothetical protein